MNGKARLHLGPSSIVGGSSVNTTLWMMAQEDIRAVTVSRVSLLWTSGLRLLSSFSCPQVFLLPRLAARVSALGSHSQPVVTWMDGN